MSFRTTVVVAAVLCMLGASPAPQQTTTPPKPYAPTVGMPGKDVVWVPTSPRLVEKMLDLAKVTSADFVMDLGSGDGRNVIAAARRGARGLGVEFNPDLVELSRRLAREAGVADRATFVQGDMYEADLSKATVLALFLLPGNLDKLKDKFLALPPGTRIVLNTFGITGWEPDVTEQLTEDCESWCTALLYIVPAHVAGRWQFDGGELTLNQENQIVSGVLTESGTGTPIELGRVRGDRLTFRAGGATYAGRVSGDRIAGTLQRASGPENAWSARRTLRFVLNI